jgi:hypothetical protein
MNKAIWQSYVYYGEKCFFVSTVNRVYDTCVGSVRGDETLVWEYNPVTKEQGELIYQVEGVPAHQAICRCLINTGEIPDRDSEEFERFK